VNGGTRQERKYVFDASGIVRTDIGGFTNIESEENNV